MQTLQGKVALITGASSGIGHATALLLARHGAAVVLGARRLAPLQALADRIKSSGGRASALAGDVRDDGYSQALVRQAQQVYGGLDIAFNNAGTLGPMGPTPEVPPDEWRSALDTNLTSAFLGARHQLPALVARGGGSLIFTSTFVGHTAGFAGVAAYAASKSGLIGLVQALAVEAGPAKVRVNALLPGGTDTPMAREMNGSPEQLAAVARLHALGRIATPDEIAQAVLFLASDASSFVTGSAMRVDGGVSIHRG
ncbi:SDR family oxidoreductase [Aquincola tertiaricarbonis]|uniref:SDR family oxidoreductase n=1 Tax=Aquincola tertiaricarbonis TaxID=391953 RepID=A0ABY4S6W7_AQUTE|nr:SDR family oxidoreductase [Aquincola tertiaricarbonis]URI08743.1 SDR family oxidoreductase [Aquincola tertiaricarbonis]